MLVEKVLTPRSPSFFKGKKVTMTFTAISRPAILSALILTIALSGRAKAAQSGASGSFEDILLALEPESPQVLEAPSLHGPAVSGQSVLIEPAQSPVQQVQPVQPHGLSLNGPSLNGPVATPQTDLEYEEYERAIQTQDPLTVAPEQIQNPFLDFEAVTDAPTPKQVDESAYALPSPQPEPRLVAPRATLPPPLPQVVAPQALPPSRSRSIVTKTIIVKPIEPDCPYRRAQSSLQLRLPPEIVARAVVPPESVYGPSRYRPDFTGYAPRGYAPKGYVPYGGRGLDWDYDRYRSRSYYSRSARYVPAYPGPHPGYRNPKPSRYSGGRDFWIGIRF